MCVCVCECRWVSESMCMCVGLCVILGSIFRSPALFTASKRNAKTRHGNNDWQIDVNVLLRTLDFHSLQRIAKATQPDSIITAAITLSWHEDLNCSHSSLGFCFSFFILWLILKKMVVSFRKNTALLADFGVRFEIVLDVSQKHEQTRRFRCTKANRFVWFLLTDSSPHSWHICCGLLEVNICRQCLVYFFLAIWNNELISVCQWSKAAVESVCWETL